MKYGSRKCAVKTESLYWAAGNPLPNICKPFLACLLSLILLLLHLLVFNAALPLFNFSPCHVLQLQGEGDAEGMSTRFHAVLNFGTISHGLYIVNVAQPKYTHTYKTWCYLTLTLRLSLWPSKSLFLSFALHPSVVLSVYLSDNTTHMGTNALAQEAISVPEQWSRKLRISLKLLITRGNVDMASFPNHNKWSPIAADKKKTQNKVGFSELNVPKHYLIQCCSHKDRHRLLIVKL